VVGMNIEPTCAPLVSRRGVTRSAFARYPAVGDGVEHIHHWRDQSGSSAAALSASIRRRALAISLRARAMSPPLRCA